MHAARTPVTHHSSPYGRLTQLGMIFAVPRRRTPAERAAAARIEGASAMYQNCSNPISTLLDPHSGIDLVVVAGVVLAVSHYRLLHDSHARTVVHLNGLPDGRTGRAS